ncbi:unnamed protein product, partial [Owenia fusiformis]
VGSALLIKTWSSNSGPYIQVLTLSYTIGNTLASLISRPFVSGVSKFNIKNNYSDIADISLTASEQFKKGNYTLGQQAPREYRSENEGNMTDISLSEVGLSNLKESDIGFVYLIIGLLSAAIGLCFLILYILTKKTFSNCLNNGAVAIKGTRFKEIDEPRNTMNGTTYTPFAKCYKLQLMATLLLMYFLFTLMQMTGGGLVMTFAVEGLKWPKSHGTAIITAYWGAQIFSKLPSIVILASKILSANQMIIIDFTLLACSYTVMVIFVQKHYIVLWVTLLTAGLGLGNLYGLCLHWYQTYVMPVTGVVTGIVVVGSNLGFTTMPFFAGFLMEVHFMWFAYVQLIAYILLLLVVILTYFLVRHNKRKLTQECDNNI